MSAAEKLTLWVKQQHAGQKIKRTEEPYINHLLFVAQMAAPVTKLGYEVGLCHDILEETAVTPRELSEAIISTGYHHEDARYIADRVIELTDVFTKAAYPKLKKAERKAKEAERLITITSGAQTIKYCDLIYNINWMITHDRKHAKDYLKRKKLLLRLMTAGDQKIRKTVVDSTSILIKALK